MKHRFLIFAVIAGGLLGQVWANTTIPAKDWTWMSSISAGPIWASGGETQTFYLVPDIEKAYVARKSTNTLASGELFVGVQKLLTSQWIGQLGLAGATTGDADLQGAIWDDADPTFNNQVYHYQIKHSHIAVKGKLLMDKGCWLIPWISGSVGAGFNRAHDFSNTSLDFEVLPDPNFKNHTKTAFTYTVGAGVQKALGSHLQVGVGYEFADWGKSELGRASGQTLNTGLTLNHLYTNGVLFNLTYIA